ncbi:MAG TPA: DUF3179 domain-containing (seleno)protein, partial [Gemmataceae bacterium]|nr:DUF3179 domain-containing (seleno)protein [Gemmataceae bacterium]
ARLKPVPTLVSQWGFWLQHYPGSVAYHMYDRYQPLELPTALNEDSRKSRVANDKRLPAEQAILGVVDGEQARAYPTSRLARSGLIADQLNGQALVILWEDNTGTAAAFRPVATPPPGMSGQPKRVTLYRDALAAGKPVTDRETGSHWDIAGRAIDGKLKHWTLEWLDGIQVKWFAWAAEHPDTSISVADRF